MWHLFPLFRRRSIVLRQVTHFVFYCGVVVESQAKSGKLILKPPVWEFRFAPGSQRGFGGNRGIRI